MIQKKESSPIPQSSQVVTTFALVSFAWVFFRAKSLDEALLILGKIFMAPGRLSIDGDTKVHVYYAIVAILLLLVMEVRRELANRNIVLFDLKSRWARSGVYAALILTMLVMGVYDAGQFIYFQF